MCCCCHAHSPSHTHRHRHTLNKTRIHTQTRTHTHVHRNIFFGHPHITWKHGNTDTLTHTHTSAWMHSYQSSHMFRGFYISAALKTNSAQRQAGQHKYYDRIRIIPLKGGKDGERRPSPLDVLITCAAGPIHQQQHRSPLPCLIGLFSGQCFEPAS